ncbi:antibiotic biosynthesis monooxygenase [Gordonia sp. CPCC 206044]|uniref:putative quinol monooxygenase n=1 Tax=Gordonia sp. CPCC 206044 TaxID=3140793 RepID=UPI003AF369B3
MNQVVLRGQLVCANADEMDAVARHLPGHIELTRAEPGCLAFDVVRTSDPHVWQVDETFVDAAAFEAHQQRVAVSDWGIATSGIERRYTVHGTG